MEEVDGMQERFNELLNEVKDAWQMVWIKDKDASKVQKWVNALIEKLNSKNYQVDALTDEVRDEKVLITEWKEQIWIWEYCWFCASLLWSNGGWQWRHIEQNSGEDTC